MKTLLLIAAIALAGCKSTPTSESPAIGVVDSGILGETASGQLIVNDAAKARYTELLARFGQMLTPTIRQTNDSSGVGLHTLRAPSPKGQTWLVSKESVSLWRLMQEWERNQK